MKSLYIFYSVARSGSTPIAAILGRYLDEFHDFTYLNEYFNYNFTGLTFGAEKIQANHSSFIPIDPSFSEKTMSQIAKKRLGQLLSQIPNSNQRYSLKVFPTIHRLIGSSYELLRPHAKVIFIRRRDVFDHLLSYLLSFSSFRFYEKKGLSFKKNSVLASESDFQNFTISVAILLHQMSLQHRPKAVFYEDFLEGGAQLVVKRTGLQKELDWREIDLPKKQTSINKLELFSNAEQIVSWYRNSSLSKL